MTEQTSRDMLTRGLTDEQVSASRREHGDNVLTPPKPASFYRLYLDKYRDPIIQILLVAAFVSLFLAFVENDFVETVGIFAAIFIATTVGFYFEMDAAKKFRVLTLINEDQPVKVRRDGHVTQIPRRDVVVGDIMLLEVGDEIPADGFLTEAVNLQVDESSLTGEQMATKSLRADTQANGVAESLEGASSRRSFSTAASLPDADKHAAYPPHVVLRSSMVMNGRGEAVVTRVGDHTEIGRVAISATEQTGTKTPLGTQLDKLAKFISKVGTAVAIVAFVVFMAHDILTNAIWQGTDYLGMAHIVINYFMVAVTLIVMAVPEGLPMAVTLALALNMRRMLKSNNLVRKLHASETMGAVTVICTDKTGTLTQNRMVVKACVAADPSVMDGVFRGVAVNTTAHLDGRKGVGNPTEVALLRWLQARGQDYRSIRAAAHVAKQQPFSTESKYMATVTDDRQIYVKGAPEVVLSMCDMRAGERADVAEMLASYQRAGMRVIALACGQGSDLATEGLRYQAMFAIEDPIRPDVPQAVEECLKAGIEVKVVTGDNSATAIEIARQIGIWNDHDPNAEDRHAHDFGKQNEVDSWHVTGEAFAALSDDEAYELAPTLKVMSRARPADKRRLVQLLQRRGEVVAVTGDGTNDAPALNHAHVGLSLGSGTSVAKQASDITILDDSFRSIAAAVMWGRSLYKNIQRFLFFQLAINLSALTLVLAGSFVGTEVPLTVTQMLWVNLIMDTFAAIALASLPPSREVMLDKPRQPTQFIITKAMRNAILWCGTLFFAAMLAFLLWCERHGPGSVIDVHELTLFFTTFVMLHFWNLFNAKCLGSHHSAFRHLARDRGLLFVSVLILVGQWAIVTFGGRVFRTLPLSAAEWMAIVGGSCVAVLGSGELTRAVGRWRMARKQKADHENDIS